MFYVVVIYDLVGFLLFVSNVLLVFFFFFNHNGKQLLVAEKN